MRGAIRIIGMVIFLMSAITGARSQVLWDVYPENPVLTVGDPGSWNESVAVATTVMFHEGIYKMWYEGDGGFGYATSQDGLSWVEYPQNPVVEPDPPAAWDQEEIVNASVVFVAGTYHMWYSGVDGDNDNRIGHATSDDGIEWTKDPDNPVFDHGPPGFLDDEEVIHPFVMYENGMYRMWYNGHDGNLQRILYAESPDGSEWTRYTAHPMLEPGVPGSWDGGLLGPLCVLESGGVYYMWYTGLSQDEDAAIGLASSPDGIDWTKVSAYNPVLDAGEPGSWEDWGAALPNVMLMGSEFWMWYGGGDGELFQTGFATSPDVTLVENEGAGEQTDLVTDHFQLQQNFPNPFNPRTTIRYQVTEPVVVDLHVYDVSGRLVRALLDGQYVEPGSHSVIWNGRDIAGGSVATGIYFYRLQAGTFSQTLRMILTR